VKEQVIERVKYIMFETGQVDRAWLVRSRSNSR